MTSDTHLKGALMGEMARTAACRFSIALGLVLTCLALNPGSARAGTYDVVACDTAPGGVHGSWTPVATEKMGTMQWCPSAGREAAGLWAGNGLNVGTIPPFAASQQKFDAPPGTSIVFFSARYMFRRFDPYWRLGVFADTQMLHGCEPAAQETGCFFNSQSIDGDSTWGWQPGQIHQVSVVTACGSGTGCRSDAAAPHGDRAGVRLYGATVRIHDESKPAIWATGGGLASDGWQRGTQTITFASSDNVGLRGTELWVDGKQLRADTRDGCDYTRRRPCDDIGSASYEVNTAGLPDGEHELDVRGVDAASNDGRFVRPFRTDNTAPSAPRELAVEGGDGWRQTNAFKLAWRNPGSAAPIRVARYRLCNASTGTCTTGSRTADAISSISDLSVPGPGHYKLRLWLEDSAGNVNDANWSDEVSLRFDNVPPGEAEPKRRNGWLNGAEARSYAQDIHQTEGDVVPVSGIAGYSVTTNGSVPDGTVDTTGSSYHVPALPEGVTTLRARAVSGAGVASLSVGSTELRVDMTSPTGLSVDAPNPDAWHRQPVDLGLTGTDQPNLSGMASAEPGLPITDGAFIAHRVNGGSFGGRVADRRRCSSRMTASTRSPIALSM